MNSLKPLSRFAAWSSLLWCLSGCGGGPQPPSPAPGAPEGGGPLPAVLPFSAVELGNQAPMRGRARALAEREAAAGACEAFLLQVFEEGEAGGTHQEVLLFPDGHGTLRYWPHAWSDGVFERELTRPELAAVGSAGAALRQVVQAEDETDDGWGFSLWHLTPGRARRVLATNPDQKSQSYALSELLRGLVRAAPLRYRLIPGPEVAGLRLELAHPDWFVSAVWAQGEDVRVRLNRRWGGLFQLADEPRPEPGWARVERGEEEAAEEAPDAPAEPGEEQPGDGDEVEERNPDPPAVQWRQLRQGEPGEVVPSPPELALDPLGWEEPPSLLAQDRDRVDVETWRRLGAQVPALHAFSLASANGRWVVGSREGQLVVFDATSDQLTRPAGGAGFVPLAALPGARVLCARHEAQDPARPELGLDSSYALLDLEEGTLRAHELSGGVVALPRHRAFQPAEAPGVVWAAQPSGPDSHYTVVGRFDLEQLRFRGWEQLDGWRFDTDRMWVDAPAARVWVVHQGALWSFPLTEPMRRDFAR